ncbi:DoxX family protein [Enterovirga rhinocerotis]|uniref:Putative membrane protein YphA (DoxX/SURF4 family) n=1 Tax=Enterovirga rhinocerotis TaxID=1339210 RepID=A0A4R7BMV3_9HYPH|nr:DoxX family protein [Enterovirga rhinocerotis]TDR85236.1 putative membrane protein YphA (DoxX/SURF4 family) [Enterovirga rhinocerotis]
MDASATTPAPRLIEGLLGLPGLGRLARLLLASPFLGSGFGKLLDFPGATAEAAGLGLRPAMLVAACVILVQLGGSALFLTRRWCWLGAGLLAGFTIVATLIAHPFWQFAGLDRVRQTATFLEHMAIVGGFVAAALLVHGRPVR